MRTSSRRGTFRRITGLVLLLVLVAVSLDLFVLSRDARAVWMSRLPPVMCGQLARLFPNDPGAQYALGQQRLDTGDYRGAAQALKKAVALAPGYIAAKAAYANVLVDIQHLAEAGTLAEECLLEGGRSEDGDEHYPDTASALVARGRLFAAAEDWGKAWWDAQRAAALQPESPDVWLLKAEIFQASGAWKQVSDAAARVTRSRPRLWKGWELLAVAALRQVDPAEALRCAERAVLVQPQAAAAQHCLSAALLASGGSEALPRAEAAALEAVRLEPQNVEAQQALCKVRLRQGRWKEAQAGLLDALHQWPEGNETRALLAQSFEAAGAPDRARYWRTEHQRWAAMLGEKQALYTRLRESDYADQIHFALARLYAKMSLWDRGRRELKRGLRRGPNPEGVALLREFDRRRPARPPGSDARLPGNPRDRSGKEASAPGAI